MEFISENLTEIFAVIGAAYILARTIVALTPTRQDDAVVEDVGVFLRNLAGLFGLNLKQGLKKKEK